MTPENSNLLARDHGQAAAERRRIWPRLRRAIFWAHLTAGCLAGLVILMLSVTGVLLTYERQIKDAVAKANWPAPPANADRLSLDTLLEGASNESFRPTRITLRAEAAAPVQFAAGRRNRIEADPWSGAERPPAAPELAAFFGTVTRLHRWFALEGEARQAAKQITGAANLVFLFLLISGLAIWLPPVWRAVMLAPRLWFSRRYVSAKARDYNWHHVIGVWCLLPLLIISATGTVFNYNWARETLRWLSGAEPALENAGGGHSHGGQARGSGHSHNGGQARGGNHNPMPDALSIDALFAAASAEAGAWNRLTLTLPRGGARTVEFLIDRGNGAQIQHQDIMTLDRRSGTVLSLAPRHGADPAARARSVNRFLHTGEIFGIPGQTLAGLASLGGAILVWTGLALAWRRLILPPLRRRRAARATPAEDAD